MEKMWDFIFKNTFNIFMALVIMSAIFMVGTFIQFMEEPIFIWAFILSIVSFLVNLGFAIAANMGKFQD